MHRSHYDVGIIGSGIAGAALATALTRQGFTVALLDRRPGLLDTARGDHIQPGVQPLLERWGRVGISDAGGGRKALRHTMARR